MSIWNLVAAILIPISGVTLELLLISKKSKRWYKQLRKASWFPASKSKLWIVVLIWLMTCVAMGIAFNVVSQKLGADLFVNLSDHTGEGYRALVAFYAVLGAHIVWIPCFFWLRSTFLGMLDSALLVTLLAICIIRFWQVDSIAGALMLVPFVWEVYGLAFLVHLFKNNGKHAKKDRFKV